MTKKIFLTTKIYRFDCVKYILGGRFVEPIAFMAYSDPSNASYKLCF